MAQSKNILIVESGTCRKLMERDGWLCVAVDPRPCEVSSQQSEIDTIWKASQHLIRVKIFV